jgi:hypothetical protein
MTKLTGAFSVFMRMRLKTIIVKTTARSMCVLFSFYEYLRLEKRTNWPIKVALSHNHRLKFVIKL